MVATGPRPRNMRCYGRDFVTTAQNFGASLDDAQRLWWRLYQRIKPSVEGFRTCSMEMAMADYLTFGMLLDYFDNPSGVPTFNRMSPELYEIMVRTVRYVTQEAAAQ